MESREQVAMAATVVAKQIEDDVKRRTDVVIDTLLDRLDLKLTKEEREFIEHGIEIGMNATLVVLVERGAIRMLGELGGIL